MVRPVWVLVFFSLLPVLLSCGTEPVETDRRVVVIGFDGVDPDLVDRWIDELPAIQALERNGTRTRLGSTNPPESPVAWSSFATGLNPGRHGIFDFLSRDPETYFPDIGLVSREKAKFLFGTIPIKAPKATNNRKGIPFWKHLDSLGIQTTNLRMPVEFPPTPMEVGQTMSGLGLPDVRLTWGTYFYLASDLTQWDLGAGADTEFGGRQIPLTMEGNKSQAVLDGPVDPRNPDGVFDRISIPIELELDDQASQVTIRVQGQQQVVPERQWSDWFEFNFEAGPFVSVPGISRFYVLETFPELRLYLMPIGLNPADPPIAFTSPAEYGPGLAEKFGLFKNVGWVHETWGLNEEQIDEGVFLEDLFRNMNALEAVLLHEIEQGDSALISTVFTATDSVAHMFYRLIDPEHPRFDAGLAERYGDSILRVYQKMDSIIGEVSSRLGPNDDLIVLSDHGFHTWRKEFNTNTWLARNGFLALEGMEADPSLQKLDSMFSGGSFFPNVDWSRTKAYSLGLGQIYINLKNREKKGIVAEGEEYDRVVDEIRESILTYRDPDNDEPVLQAAYRRDDIWHGPETEHAGDIQLSFRTGYRTSWQTALGSVPENILVANLKKWSGDHCASDVSDTSGFLLLNRKLQTQSPSIFDVAPTLYRIFGVEPPVELDGQAWDLSR